MRKIWFSVFSIVIFLGLIMNNSILAEENSEISVNVDGENVSLQKIKVNVNGKKVESDVPAVNYRGNSLVPARFVSEELGADVKWDGKNNSAIIESSNKKIILRINSSKAIINGEEKEIPGKAMSKLISTSSSKSSRTMVPLRFIAETLGADVKWDNETFTANIILDEVNTNTPIEKDEEINSINDIKGIEKQVINGKEAIVIKNTYASKSNVFKLSSPERLVVDIRNTNLNDINNNTSTDLIKGLRLGQYEGNEYDPSEKVARIVLDISENYENPTFTTQERGNDLIVFVEGTKKEIIVPPIASEITKPVPPTGNSGNGKTIVIDPGHGGSKPGSVYNGIKEKDVALRASLKTQEELEKLGYKVLMTRTTDVNPSFSDRYNLGNVNNADAFISIHFNAVSGIPTATGIETLYGTKNSQNKAFAQSIQDELITNTKSRDRGLKLRNDLAVLNGTKGISVLAELGFISNPNDAKEIVTESYMKKCAIAIANGIHKFFSR